MRRFALATAVLALVAGTILILRRSALAGGLFYVAGALVIIALMRPSIVEGLWPGASWHRSAITRGLLVAAFVAFLGGILVVPRSSSTGADRDAEWLSEPERADGGVAPDPTLPVVVAQGDATMPTGTTVREGTPTAASGVAVAGTAPESVMPPASATAAAAPVAAAPIAVAPSTPAVVPPTVRPAPSVVVGAAAGANAQPTLIPLPSLVPPTATVGPEFDAFLARIEVAWDVADWPAAEAATLQALAAFPNDPALLDKLYAARINRGDQLVERGQRVEAARIYAAARDVRRDPVVEGRLAALTPTVAPRRSVAFTGQCQPGEIAIGDWFVAQFGVLNTGDTPLDGVRIKASGPWERFTLSRLEPVDVFRLEGPTVEPEFVARVPLQPGQAIYMQVVAYAEQSGQYLFSFRPAQIDNQALSDQVGRSLIVGCGIAVES